MRLFIKLHKDLKMGSFIAGNLGLAKTYWFFGVIGSVIVRFIMTFIIMSGINPIIAIVIGFGYSITVWIAVWNSATKYEGLKLWAILAKVSVVFGILASLAQFNQ